MTDPTARRPVSQFGPDRRRAVVALVLGIIAAAVAGFGTDAEGRLLAGCAAVVLLALAGGDLVFWPRLVARAGGIAIRDPTARVRLSWSQIDAIRVDERTRLGRANQTLEIDAG